MELQAELHLARSRRSAGDGARRAGWAIAGGRGRREDDEIGRVEIGAVQKVEDFRAELQSQAFPKRDLLQNGEIPSGESGADVSVTADVAIKAAGGWRCDKRGGIEPLAGLAEDYGAAERGIEEGTHGITCVTVV